MKNMETNYSWWFYKSVLNRQYNRADEEKLFPLIGVQGWAKYKIWGEPNTNYLRITDPLPGRELHRLKLMTIYPGLVLGTGYAHPIRWESKKGGRNPSDYQMGFFFDHTTGLPVLPGSSVKGVLRSVFPQAVDEDDVTAGKQEYIAQALDLQPADIDSNLQTALFHRRHVFHDAFVSAVAENAFSHTHQAGNGASSAPNERRLFMEDYLTPHGEDRFKEPKPLRFLKVAPGVTFTFTFQLDKTVLSSIGMKAEQILPLFTTILCDFGIGAKRNYGYGHFKHPDARLRTQIGQE